jgi:hypothetical protein
MRKVIHVTATWKIEELKKTTLALASTFYASAHIYGACVCVCVCVCMCVCVCAL